RTPLHLGTGEAASLWSLQAHNANDTYTAGSSADKTIVRLLWQMGSLERQIIQAAMKPGLCKPCICMNLKSFAFSTVILTVALGSRVLGLEWGDLTKICLCI
ncbi:unnamed protein product, partial [Laminaria digitata]